ncbi:MAG: carbohydrate kinase [Ignavibacteria bacterium]|jgi:fructokinase
MNRITAIGEILFDVYPGLKKLGGAPLNFLYHVYKFTGAGNMISRIGNDDFGKKILYFLNYNKISIQHIQIDQEHPTGVATVKLNEKNEPSFTIEANRAYDFIETSEGIRELIKNNTDCLYFGSLAQRSEVSRNTIRSLMGKEIKYFCDLNIRQNFYDEKLITHSLNAADILKVNLDELKLINDLIIKDSFDLKKTSEKIIKEFNLDLAAITKGAEGSVLIKGNAFNEFQNEPTKIYDSVGAGDAFSSVLCIGYLNGWELATINRLANRFASEICQVAGALPVDDKIYRKYREEFTYAKK